LSLRRVQLSQSADWQLSCYKEQIKAVASPRFEPTNGQTAALL
jgi:hypothetical protein